MVYTHTEFILEQGRAAGGPVQYSVELVRKHLRRSILDGYFPPAEPLPSIQR